MPFAPPATVVQPDARGNLVLSPLDADLDGRVQAEQKGGQWNFGYWDNSKDSVSWTVRFPTAGKYHVRTACASEAEGVSFVVAVGSQELSGTATKTGGWDDFVPMDLGTVSVPAPGKLQVRVHSKDPSKWRAINLRALTFTPE
jgi:hypothetical protein